VPWVGGDAPKFEDTTVQTFYEKLIDAYSTPINKDYPYNVLLAGLAEAARGWRISYGGQGQVY
jgi:hypothetical protein